MTRRTILFDCNIFRKTAPILLAGILAGGIAVSPVLGQSAAPAAKSAVATGTSVRYTANRYPKRASAYYALFWGIDSPRLKAVESGQLIRFSYTVLDGNKAATLNDKKAQPYLVFPGAGIRLSIPSLEKVGQLRQSSTPEAGMSYWMAFSNPGRRVKSGDRVNIVIGQFHADGLIVE